MRYFLIVFVLLTFSVKSQDTLYAREVIKALTSKKCFGRGYLNNGLEIGAKYITSQIKIIGAKPLFGKSYFQEFKFDVNTFPSEIILKVNDKLLVPGKDFIVSPESGSLKGKFDLKRKDSVTFVSEGSGMQLRLVKKKKLTYSVSTQILPYVEFDVLDKNVPNEITSAEVEIKNKFISGFKNKNICAFIEGKVNNDTMIIYSAHYDHLGGMGKSTFFPGANDNASGVSVLLNLAKYYVKNPPKYKTVFVFFAGEEAGLIGSKYFVDNKTVELSKIKFLINLDLLGTGDDGIMVVNGAIHTKQFELINKINSEKNLVKEIKKRGKAQNSDHYWFTEAGVPAIFIYTLGGNASYHDIFDIEKTLPLTDYIDVFKLITEFVSKL